MASTDTIDINLYDRQVRTYGIDAVKKMTTSSVLIYGLDKGLATEVAKNLALGGIKNIYLYDSQLVTPIDTETGFYYDKDSIDKPRAEVLVPKLQELNPYVTIHVAHSYQQDQNVTIVINQPVETVKEISKYTRLSNSKLIVLYSSGISGAIFVDAGNSHLITDSTGENIEPVQIGEILSNGTVNCAPNSSHDFQDGDYIMITNLQGDNVEQFEKEWRIKNTKKTSFVLCDFNTDNTLNKFSFVNGTAIHIKKSETICHQDFTQQIEEPTLSFSFDMDGSRDIVDTYLQMYTYHDSDLLVNIMPHIWSDSNDTFLNKYEIKNKDIARIINFELMPVVSLMGSITASEAVKLVTNKYKPINQWFTWSDSSLIPKSAPDGHLDAKTAYGKLFGLEFEQKLVNSNWLMVGSGAIGCEHLKNLAYMNIANSNYGSGKIIVTDPDSIEKSNLNRQFLFRPQHIGKHKSQIAPESINKLRPGMNIVSHLEKVGSDNQAFTDNVLSQVTGVLNALDNIKARRFMDEQCFKYGLPLFESGTTGTKGNTQPVIPFVTETYSASSDPDQEKSFPICTIKSFPNEISHTIHWAMDQFEFFNRAPQTLNKWIQNSSYLTELGQIERSIASEDINMFTNTYPTTKSVDICAKWAVDMFTENYYNSIVQLLHSFPPNHETAPGVPFWSAGKRCPTPIKFDINNPIHMDYIEATTNIIARCSGYADLTRSEIIQYIQDYEPVEFTPKSDVKIASTDAELEQINNSSNSQVNSVVLPDSHNFTATYVSQEFEKDDDTNWHISWVTAASNIRAMNYSITPADRQQTKGIAGRIIPAIATNTSAVSGLILLEMIKHLMNFNKVDTYRSTFINLAEPVVVYSDPIEAPTIDVAGVKLNSWTQFNYTKDSTLGEFFKYYEEMFKTTINMSAIGTVLVYADGFVDKSTLDEKLSTLICKSLEITDNKVPANLSFTLLTEDNIDIPTINVNLQHINVVCQDI